MTTKYSVNFWGSHPDSDNDDCWTGHDFATLAEAEAFFAAPSFCDYCPSRDVAFIELALGTREGCVAYTETIRVRKNPEFRKRREDHDEWRREIAREAGMLHGIDAYNDEMGY